MAAVRGDKMTQTRSRPEDPTPAEEATVGTAKRIVLFSDGTGNSSAKLFKTNVWRLYDALDVDPVQGGADPVRQIAYYDNGVGTSSFRPLAILGGALGVGLARNVRDIYAFLCRNYQAGDEIYGFGFSRGAFTMRVVAGLIAREGVITDFSDDEDLKRKVAQAYRTYRADLYDLNSFMAWLVILLRWLRDGLFAAWHHVLGHAPFNPAAVARPDITFLGLWDTVDAYGLPIDEMTAAWDQYIWPLTMRDYTLHEKVLRARHVLALDDERQTFHPRLWQHDPADNAKTSIDDRRIAQVWFAGVHSNVGGGYPNDSLSFVSLNWMLQRIDIAQQHRCNGAVFGLRFHPEKVALYRESADVLGPIYDSRSGLGGYYRYQPRKFAYLTRQEALSPIKQLARKYLPDRVLKPSPPASASAKVAPSGERIIDPGVQLVHHSVFDRIQMPMVPPQAGRPSGGPGKAGYAPLTIEDRYLVVGPDSAGAPILDISTAGYESPEKAAARGPQVDSIYNLVWLRRVTYFACLFFSAWLAGFPFWHGIEKTAGDDPTLETIVSAIPAVAASFLPGFLKPWIDAYAAHAWLFLALVLAVVALLWLGGFLAATIHTLLEKVWRHRIAPRTRFWWPAVDGLRNSRGYKRFHHTVKIWVLPALFAAIFYHFLTSVASRVVFAGVYDTATCKPAADRKLSFPADGKITITTPYAINSMCWASGVTLEGGRRYEITLVAKAKGDTLLEKPGGNGWLAPLLPDALLPVPIKADMFGFNHEATGLSLGRRLWMEVIWFYRLPLRRDMFEPWFSQHVRIGNTGRDTQPLFPKVPPARDYLKRDTLVADFTARRNGEMFLFTNEAIGRIAPFDHYYKGNRGEISVSIRQLDWDPDYSRH